MYIEKTTAAERLIIQGAVDGSFVYVMRARRLLVQVLDDYFGDAEQESISRFDAERISDILRAVDDALWYAETEYSLTVGDEAAPGCEAYYNGAAMALRVREVERLRAKLGHKNTEKYLDLDDEEALALMQEVAE